MKTLFILPIEYAKRENVEEFDYMVSRGRKGNRKVMRRNTFDLKWPRKVGKNEKTLSVEILGANVCFQVKQTSAVIAGVDLLQSSPWTESVFGKGEISTLKDNLNIFNLIKSVNARIIVVDYNLSRSNN